MKSFAICFLALLSLNVFAAGKCTPSAQNQIDSILVQISRTDDEIVKIDLEFEMRQISYSYTNCKKSVTNRNIASVESSEVNR